VCVSSPRERTSPPKNDKGAHQKTSNLLLGEEKLTDGDHDGDNKGLFGCLKVSESEEVRSKFLFLLKNKNLCFSRYLDGSWEV